MGTDKVVVLLSAGLDSTYNLYEANKRQQVALALTFNYGQKAAPREVAQAQKICEHLGVSHEVIDLSWFERFTSTSLVETNHNIPAGKDVQIDSAETSQKTARAVWVPNRNGIFLNIAAGFAEGLGALRVVAGFNSEEAVTFPDNSEEFLDSVNESLYFSTKNSVKVISYSTKLTKESIVRKSRELGVPFNWIWPCYNGGENLCRQCESCTRFLRALNDGGVEA